MSEAGGSIRLSSEIGQGTTFSVSYPLSQAPAKHVHAPEARRVFAPELLNPSTIMICEDDNAVRAVLCEYLQGSGYQVISCDNSVEALLMAQQHRPETLITDIVMPGEDGIQLARQLRAQQPALNVILISGHTDQEVLRRLAECSDMTFLEKPFTSAALLDCLRRPPEKQN